MAVYNHHLGYKWQKRTTRIGMLRNGGEYIAKSTDVVPIISRNKIHYKGTYVLWGP